MDIVLLIFFMIVAIGTLIMAIYLGICSYVGMPYKEFYKGFKGIKEYYEKQKDELQEASQKQRHIYKKLEQDFFKYFKEVWNITKEKQEIDLEEFWKQATYDKNIYKQVEKAHLAVEEAKRQYEQISKIKEEYDSFVNDFFDEDEFPEGGLKDMINIKKKFEENYKFNENPAISFIEAGRIVVDSLKRKQESYDAMKKRGIDVEPLSIVEEIVLIHLKPRIEEWEMKLENIKRAAKEEAMLSAIEDLKGQNMYLQQLLNNRK